MAVKTEERIGVPECIRLLIKLGARLNARGLISPLNGILTALIVTAIVFVVLRFSQGLGAVMNPSQFQPWGLFLSWGLFSSIPLAGAAFIFGALVHVFGIEKFKPYVKNAILIGVIGYVSAAIFLLMDLGRPWLIYHPIIITFGVTSILFIVAWTMILHVLGESVEFLPSVWSWLGRERLYKWNRKLCMGLAIFIATISTVHQSALGGLFLVVPEKLHPLWYSPLLPLLFFVSALAAGFSIVPVISMLNRRFFRDNTDGSFVNSLDGVTLTIGRIVAYILGTYLILKIITLVISGAWSYLGSAYGIMYFLEIGAFTLLPMLLLIRAGCTKAKYRFSAGVTDLDYRRCYA